MDCPSITKVAAVCCWVVREENCIGSGFGIALVDLSIVDTCCREDNPSSVCVATMERISSPYNSNFFGPIPLTWSNSSSLVGSNVHIPSKAALVNTLYAGLPKVDA